MKKQANTQSSDPGRPEYYVGIDIGGTFTDVILIDKSGKVHNFKTPTVPAKPSEGFMNGLLKAAKFLDIPLEALLRSTNKLSYGNTIATNALLEKKVAKTGLIITRGFRDVLAIARVGREYLGIDLQCQRPDPLVPGRQIEEITERVDSQGDVVIPLKELEIEEILDKFAASGIEAVAVSLLWSFKNPEHEKKIGRAIQKKLPGIYFSLSHEIAPTIGEYERTATTVINTSLGPLLESHLGTISDELEQGGLPVPLLLMQSTGGVVPTADAVLRPITLVNSVNPNRIEGQKTAAFEIVDDLGGAPDYLFIPVGNAGNISAYWKGFLEYHGTGKAGHTPRMMGFQAAGAAPIVLNKVVKRPRTIATAIRIGNPASWQKAVAARDESGGIIDYVTDDEIINAYRLAANKEGIFGEPASAASLAGLIKLSKMKNFSDKRVVCIVTGTGLKDPDMPARYAQAPIELPADLAAIEELLGLRASVKDSALNEEKK